LCAFLTFSVCVTQSQFISSSFLNPITFGKQHNLRDFYFYSLLLPSRHFSSLRSEYSLVSDTLSLQYESKTLDLFYQFI
jgi:hypothetical protein